VPGGAVSMAEGLAVIRGVIQLLLIARIVNVCRWSMTLRGLSCVVVVGKYSDIQGAGKDTHHSISFPAT
jgi:hypothetical protein